jgi:DNA-binding NarL/FixJ family response regulator
VTLCNAAQLALYHGDADRAWEIYEQSLALFAAFRDPLNTADVLAGFAAVAAARGDWERAVRWLAAAQAECDSIGASVVTHEAQFRRTVAAAQRALDPAAYAAAWATGRTLTLDQALAEAREARTTLLAADRPGDRPTSDGLDAGARLTPRELEVLRLLATGRSDKEIAAALSISYRTVTNHVANILAKLGAESRTAAATYAVRAGLA